MNICPERKSIEETKCWLLHDMYPSPNIAHFNIARYLIQHWRKYNRSKNFYYILAGVPYRRFYECFEVSVLYSIIFTKWLYAVIISDFEPGFQSSVNMPQGVAHWLESDDLLEHYDTIQSQFGTCHDRWAWANFEPIGALTPTLAKEKLFKISIMSSWTKDKVGPCSICICMIFYAVTNIRFYVSMIINGRLQQMYPYQKLFDNFAE